MERISNYISYQEATVSQTAIRKKIDNIPTLEILEAMHYVAENVFDKIREHFGVPLIVSSFYRSTKLNRAVGGAATSQHVKGEAIDIQGTESVSNKMIFEYVKEHLVFDQLINEYPDKSGNPAWVHVSLKKTGNRGQVLTIR